VLVVAGDFDEAIARETIDAYFGGYAKAQPPPRPDFKGAQPFTQIVRDTIYDQKARLPGVFISWQGVGMKGEDAYAADLLSTIISEGESSRLYRTVVDSLQVAVQAAMFNQALEYGGICSAIGIASPGKNIEDAEKAILAVLEEVATNGVTDDELQKAKNIAEAQFVGSRSSMESIAGSLAQARRYHGKTAYVNEDLDHYLKVTKADVLRVAKKLFSGTGRVTLVYIPAKG
jgi:predicted Zn-dependent peptidase